MTNIDWIINVKHLSKSFRHQPAVVDLSLQIRRGEIFGFLGPNGTGKTTTIRMLCGLLTPDTGEGQCMGYDIIKDSDKIKSQVGYMTQHFSLYKEMTVYQNLNFRAQLYGLKNRSKIISNLMEQLGLTERQNQIAKTLSTGWKQRLALAGAVIHQPLLLLLDEPTAGVDPSARRDFWELIHQFASEGTSILLSTHNMDEVERCQRIAYMAKGKIVTHGTIPELVNKVKLTTWSVEGPNLPLLTKQLEILPGVGLVTTFYNTLHVSGTDSQELEESIKPFMQLPNYKWSVTKASLEDMFIWLSKMQSRKDNS